MAKTNYNGSANAASTKQIAGANSARLSFFFKSKGDTFVLNFGASATEDNILQINPNESIFLDRSSPFDITLSLNVYCANASEYQAQVDE